MRKIVRILDPLPPLCTHLMKPISTVVRKIGHISNPPPPRRVSTMDQTSALHTASPVYYTLLLLRTRKAQSKLAKN